MNLQNEDVTSINNNIENAKPFVDYSAYGKLVQEVEQHRAERLILLDDFLEKSKESNISPEAPGCVTPNISCGVRCCTQQAGISACCDKVCVSLLASRQHCGFCGKRCADDQLCRQGQCVCAPPYVSCGRACINPQLNPKHCGKCYHV